MGSPSARESGREDEPSVEEAGGWPGMGVARPGQGSHGHEHADDRATGQPLPTCQPSLGPVSPSHPAWGLAEAARRSLAPGTKCSAQRPPGFRDFEGRQRGSAGGEAGWGDQMPVGPPSRQHKYGLSLPAPVSSLPYIPACPAPEQGACIVGLA